MSEFKHIPSGVVFDNRKQAVKVMGRSRYLKALDKCEFEFKRDKNV